MLLLLLGWKETLPFLHSNSPIPMSWMPVRSLYYIQVSEYTENPSAEVIESQGRLTACCPFSVI